MIAGTSGQVFDRTESGAFGWGGMTLPGRQGTFRCSDFAPITSCGEMNSGLARCQ
jgi:hypothetical protein